LCHPAHGPRPRRRAERGGGSSPSLQGQGSASCPGLRTRRLLQISSAGGRGVMRYAFIGLGNLGGHLAASLIRGGFTVTVHDLNRQAADRHVALGAAWAASPAEAAAGADAVFTCLPSPKASTAVLAGERGVLAGLKSGGTWIEMSTNDKDEIERIAAIAAAKGIDTLEAPVTGGVHRAAAGEIAVLVGGDKKIFEAHRPALQAMGGEIFHMGPLGSAAVIKVITNMLAFIHLVAAGEALM